MYSINIGVGFIVYDLVPRLDTITTNVGKPPELSPPAAEGVTRLWPGQRMCPRAGVSDI